MRRRAKKRSLLPILLLGEGILILLASFLLCFQTSGEMAQNSAVQAVNKFYQYERAGDFGSSWELFHPLMKEKFPQDQYIQKRAHVFMQDFGVNTFTFKLGKPVFQKKWIFSRDRPELKKVYKIPVTQTFSGTFGDFDIRQNVYAAEKNKHWYILWSFKE